MQTFFSLVKHWQQNKKLGLIALPLAILHTSKVSCHQSTKHATQNASNFRWGYAPEPIVRTHNAPQDSLVDWEKTLFQFMEKIYGSWN